MFRDVVEEQLREAARSRTGSDPNDANASAEIDSSLIASGRATHGAGFPRFPVGSYPLGTGHRGRHSIGNHLGVGASRRCVKRLAGEAIHRRSRPERSRR